MDNYQKLQAIQGLIHDFEERMYFQASKGVSEDVIWTDEMQEKQVNNVINAIKEILK